MILSSRSASDSQSTNGGVSDSSAVAGARHLALPRRRLQDDGARLAARGYSQHDVRANPPRRVPRKRPRRVSTSVSLAEPAERPRSASPSRNSTGSKRRRRSSFGLALPSRPTPRTAVAFGSSPSEEGDGGECGGWRRQRRLRLLRTRRRPARNRPSDSPPCKSSSSGLASASSSTPGRSRRPVRVGLVLRTRGTHGRRPPGVVLVLRTRPTRTPPGRGGGRRERLGAPPAEVDEYHARGVQSESEGRAVEDGVVRECPPGTNCVGLGTPPQHADCIVWCDRPRRELRVSLDMMQ